MCILITSTQNHFLIKKQQFDDLNKGYAVRLYHPGDELEIVPLLQLAFDGWPHLDKECSLSIIGDGNTEITPLNRYASPSQLARKG